MELFERIRFLSKEKKVPLAKIAEHIKLTPQNFNKWFNKKTQRRFYDYLPTILELFPDVREEWLYIGREPAFKDGTVAEDMPTIEQVKALKAENERLNAELNEERALNRKLTNRLLHDGVTDEKSVADTARVVGQE